jgi:hypothetical protein
MQTRHQYFRLNPRCPLHRNLVFAGLGGFGMGASGAAGPAAFFDSSIGRNHATVAGTPTWATFGIGRPSMLFGTSYPINGSPAYSSGFPTSLAAWVYQTSTAGKYILEATYFGGSASFLSMAISSGNTLYYYQNSSARQSSITLSLSTWYHICMCFDSTTNVRLYVNGVSQFITQPSGAFTLGVPYISVGARDPNATGFVGYLSDPMIWSRSLSALEAKALGDPENINYDCGGIPLIQSLSRRRSSIIVPSGNRRRRVLCAA